MPEAALHTSYASTTDAVPDAVADLQDFGEALPIAQDTLDRLLLAAAEAVANGVEHGNAYDASKSVVMRLDREVSAWVLRVRDEGVGLPPDALENVALPEDLLDTGGRGLFIIQQLADAIWLEEQGRCVCLRFEDESGEDGQAEEDAGSGARYQAGDS